MSGLSTLFERISRSPFGSRKNSIGTKTRKLACETLEDRCLLSITTTEYEAVQSAFSDFNLASDPDLVNKIDLEELSLDAIGKAVEKACTTENDDLIVLRATENEFVEFVNSFSENEKIVINVNEDFGAVNIVGLNADGEAYNPLDLITRYDYSVNGEGGFINGTYYFPLPDDDLSTEEGFQAGIQAAGKYTQAWHSLINLDDFYKDSRYTNFNGAGYTTVIIDTGIYEDNVLFQDANGNSRIIYQYDFVYNDGVADDEQGHGTHVAGIAAGYDATRGYSGVASGANIIALKVFGTGNASSTDVEEALNWVIEHGKEYNVVSVNMSLGSGNYQSHSNARYGEEIDALTDLGIAVCVATGNDYDILQGTPGVASPACVESCISVGAVHSENIDFGYDINPVPDQITYFTQRMEGLVDIFAPGANMISAGTSSSTSLVTMSGTSMACPVMAGTVVIAQQLATTLLGSSLSVQGLLDIMQNTAVEIYDGDDETTDFPATNTWYKRIDFMAMANMIYSYSISPTLSRLSLSDYSPEVGDTITSYLSPSQSTASYQWYRSTTGADNSWTTISGASRSSYTVTASDIGYFFRLYAVGTGDFADSTVFATTNLKVTKTLESVNVAANGVDIGIDSGKSLYYGETSTLTATLGPAGASATWQWARGRSLNGTFSAISGATSTTYNLTSSDVGYYLMVTATGSGNYTGVVSAVTGYVYSPISAVIITFEGEEVEKLVVGMQLGAAVTPEKAAVTWKWSRVDAEGNETQVGTSSTYTTTQADIGYYIKLEVTARNKSNTSGSASYTTTNVVKQELGYVTLSTGEPAVGIEISTEIVPNLDNAAELLDIAWYRIGDNPETADTVETNFETLIDGATGTTYTPTADDLNYRLKVVISGKEGTDFEGQSISASTTECVTNRISAVTLSEDSPYTSQVLTALITPDSIDVNSSGLIWKWSRAQSETGTYREIEGANSSSYTVTDDDAGYFIRVTVTGTGAYLGTQSATTAVKVITKLTSLTLSSNTPVYGENLIATPNTTATPVTYTWYRDTDGDDGNDGILDDDAILIEGTEGNMYLVSENDTNFYIWAVATEVLPEGSDSEPIVVTAITSSTTTRKLTYVSISNIAPIVGEELSYMLSPLEGKGTPSWFRVGDNPLTDTVETDFEIAIDGANEKTYTVTADDIGYFIRVKVTGTEGFSGTVVSTSPFAVTCSISSIEFDDTPFLIGNTIGTIIDVEEAEIQYEWYRGTLVENEVSYTIINNANDSSYTLTQDDLDCYIKVIASGIDGYSGYAETSTYKLVPPVTVFTKTKAILEITSDYDTFVDYSDSVSLSAVDSVGADGETSEGLTWYWDLYGNGKGTFIEGTSTAVFTPAEQTLPDGVYTVRVKVVDASGIANIASLDITVKSEFEAILSVDGTVVNTDTIFAERTIPLLLSAEDSVGVELSYYWDLGTGKYTKGEATTEYTPERDGTSVIRLKVVDSRNNVSEKTLTLNVGLSAPEIYVEKTSINEGQLLAMNIQLRDPHSESVSSWSINWGDGKGYTKYYGSCFYISTAYYYGDITEQTTFDISVKFEDSTRWKTFEFELGQHVVKPNALPNAGFDTDPIILEAEALNAPIEEELLEELVVQNELRIPAPTENIFIEETSRIEKENRKRQFIDLDADSEKFNFILENSFLNEIEYYF